MSGTTEKPAETRTTTDATAPAAPSAGPRLAERLRLVGLNLKLTMIPRRLMVVIGAVAVFVLLTLFLAFGLRNRLEPTTDAPAEEGFVEEPPVPEELLPTVDPLADLSPRELVGLAETALAEKRTREATDLLDRARDRVKSDDTLTRIRIYEGLARASEAAGIESHARIHRDFVARLQLRLGPTMPLLSAADQALAGGDAQAAVRLYNRFLLRAEEILLDKESLVRHTKDRIAEALLADYERQAPKSVLSLEPEGFFR